MFCNILNNVHTMQWPSFVSENEKIVKVEIKFGLRNYFDVASSQSSI